MLLWIYCSGEISPPVFGISNVERHWLAAKRAKLPVSSILLCCKNTAIGEAARASLSEVDIPVKVECLDFTESLTSSLAEENSMVLATTDDTLADGRLYSQVATSAFDFVAVEKEAIFARLSHSASLYVEGTSLQETLKNIPSLRQDQFNSFIPKLRRSLPFYLFRIRTEEDRKSAEKFLFWSNYKGSTDLFTAYVYPPLVWLLVRPLAKARIHPNTVTWFSIFLTFLAIPLFASGYFTWGFVCAYGMSVLDSVDGKLARVSFADSPLGNVLDHGLDLIHPPMWYLAWAWGLSGGDYHAHIFVAAILMTGLYIFDRLILKIYPTLYRRGLHTHGKLDIAARSIISRRNINLPLFTAGYYLGLGEPVFIFIVLWQAATCIFHGFRTAYILFFDRPLSLP